MAGNYPDAPGPRMAWDSDGSIFVRVSNGVPTVLTQANAKLMNNEADDQIGGLAANTTNWMVVIFPELRDIAGYWFVYTGGNYSFVSFGGMQTSVDTTNGLDGTWVTVTGAVAGQATAAKPAYRTSINAKAIPGVKAVRFGVNDSNSFGPNAKNLHLYGQPSGASGDRLEMWHATLNQRLGAADFDWGNAPQGSVATRQFRVKNASATLTANAPVLSFESLTDSTPTQVSQHTLSTDGTTFAATVTLGNLAPGAVSPVLSIRRSEQAAAVLGLWALRLKAVPASWS